jgi:hypothetical protein
LFRGVSVPEAVHSAETIYIHVEDPRVGVIAYYAVLAYPKRTEAAKRPAFSDALIAIWMKEFARGLGRKNVPTFYTGYKNEKIWGGLRPGLKRLARRLSAGIIGWSVVLGGGWEALGPSGMVELFVPGPTTIDGAIRGYVGQRGTDEETETAAKNAMHRVWAESLPVLHLAMKNPIVVRTEEARLNGKEGPPSEPRFIDEDLLNSIFDPQWLRESLEGAEELRPTLGDLLGTNPNDRLYRGFRPENAIRLLPPIQTPRLG